MECWPNVTGNSLKIAAEVLSKGAKYDWVDWEMKTTSTKTRAAAFKPRFISLSTL